MPLPTDKARYIEEVARVHADRFQEWEDRIWEEGLSIFGKAKPQDRLKWYMSQTLPQDFGMVLDLDYRQKRKDGLAGPLAVEMQFQQYKQDAALVAQAQQEAEASGVQVPPEMMAQIQPPPMMWVQLLGMSARFMQKVQSDFRALLNSQARREGLVESAPQPQIPQEVGY